MAQLDDQKVPLILFSGGLDSTYLLELKLREGDVETMYVSGAQSPDKIQKELAARKAIIAVLEKETGHQVRKDYSISLPDVMGGRNYVPDHTFLQPMMWLTGALHVTNADRHSELLIAYVTGDGILSHLHQITQAWESIQGFTKTTSIPIGFPTMHFSKQNILDNISRRAVQHVWVCELPETKRHTVKSCGNCVPCLTMAGQLHIWEKRNGMSYAKNTILRFNYKVDEIVHVLDPHPPEDELCVLKEEVVLENN